MEPHLNCLLNAQSLFSSLNQKGAQKSHKNVPMFLNPLHACRLVDWVMLMDQDTQWLYQLLAEVQLEKFYIRIRDGLNITRIDHFHYVKESDLEQIGISKPGEPWIHTGWKSVRATQSGKILLKTISEMEDLKRFWLLKHHLLENLSSVCLSKTTINIRLLLLTKVFD